MGVSKADKFLVYADIHGKIMSISADFPPKKCCCHKMLINPLSVARVLQIVFSLYIVPLKEDGQED